MSKKIQKRVKKTSLEYEESVARASASAEQQASEDEVLFSLDRVGSKNAKRKVTQELVPKANGNFVSETEKKLIKRAATKTKQQPYHKFKTAVGSNEVRDLWGDTLTEGDSTEKSHKRLKVALPGQSYNPSTSDHQNTVAEAVALQLKRDEALATSSARVVARKLAAEAMDYEEVGAIPLSDELGGGLRTILPKGVALSHRAAAMRKSGDIAVVERRSRRSHEKPHAPRRTAWHAKYKYTD